MSLNEILSVDSGRKERMRVGRGAGSGRGKTAGRGNKGEGSRAGGKNRGPLFEGGQFPLWMRLPKRGFTNSRHTQRYQALRLKRVLDRVDGDEITVETLVAAGLADAGERIKLVSGEKLDRKLRVKVHKVTASVKQAVEAAGGSVEAIDG